MPGQQEQRPGQDAEAGGAHQGVDQAELQPHALLSLQIRTIEKSSSKFQQKIQRQIIQVSLLAWAAVIYVVVTKLVTDTASND